MFGGILGKDSRRKTSTKGGSTIEGGVKRKKGSNGLKEEQGVKKPILLQEEIPN